MSSRVAPGIRWWFRWSTWCGWGRRRSCTTSPRLPPHPPPPTGSAPARDMDMLEKAERTCSKQTQSHWLHPRDRQPLNSQKTNNRFQFHHPILNVAKALFLQMSALDWDTGEVSRAFPSWLGGEGSFGIVLDPLATNEPWCSPGCAGSRSASGCWAAGWSHQAAPASPPAPSSARGGRPGARSRTRSAASGPPAVTRRRAWGQTFLVRLTWNASKFLLWPQTGSAEIVSGDREIGTLTTSLRNFKITRRSSSGTTDEQL